MTCLKYIYYILHVQYIIIIIMYMSSHLGAYNTLPDCVVVISVQ